MKFATKISPLLNCYVSGWVQQFLLGQLGHQQLDWRYRGGYHAPVKASPSHPPCHQKQAKGKQWHVKSNFVSKTRGIELRKRRFNYIRDQSYAVHSLRSFNKALYSESKFMLVFKQLILYKKRSKIVSAAVFPLRISYAKNLGSNNWTTIIPLLGKYLFQLLRNFLEHIVRPLSGLLRNTNRVRTKWLSPGAVCLW